MARESTQQKLSRNRPPRVQITYDVEVGGAQETKELPFVLAVVGDYAGQTPQTRMKDRKFVQIDKDTFDDVLKGVNPSLQFTVPNRLQGDGSELPVNLEFEKLEDFEPQEVAKQVDPLRKLVEVRQKLSDLRNKMIGNEKLETLLESIIADTDKLQSIQQASAPEGGDR